MEQINKPKPIDPGIYFQDEDESGQKHYLIITSKNSTVNHASLTAFCDFKNMTSAEVMLSIFTKIYFWYCGEGYDLLNDEEKAQLSHLPNFLNDLNLAEVNKLRGDS